MCIVYVQLYIVYVLYFRLYRSEESLFSDVKFCCEDGQILRAHRYEYCNNLLS